MREPVPIKRNVRVTVFAILIIASVVIISLISIGSSKNADVNTPVEIKVGDYLEYRESLVGYPDQMVVKRYVVTEVNETSYVVNATFSYASGKVKHYEHVWNKSLIIMWPVDFDNLPAEYTVQDRGIESVQTEWGLELARLYNGTYVSNGSIVYSQNWVKNGVLLRSEYDMENMSALFELTDTNIPKIKG